MPKICYVDKKFSANSEAVIVQANKILAEYAEQGYDLTLRQLYYQFVAADLIPNSQRSYKRLGSIINDARMVGRIDWNLITDRTRNVRALSHWDKPGDIINSARRSFRLDRWADQDHKVEVWIEKDALVGVIEGVCNQYDVPFFSCRGYTSQSELWAAGVRMYKAAEEEDKIPVVIHLGDHDPSGVDMTRDIHKRVQLFSQVDVEVKRIALNMDQIDEFGPPPNPAKLTDSRCRGYIEEFGEDSWELDALRPNVITELIRAEIRGLIDYDRWDITERLEDEMREDLKNVSDRWEDVVRFLRKGKR